MARRSTAFGNFLEISAANGGTAINDIDVSGTASALRGYSISAWAYASAAMVTGESIATSFDSGTDIPLVLAISHATSGMTAGRWRVGAFDASSSDWDYAIDSVAHEVGQWVHLVGTHDGTDFRLYKNGRFVNQGGSVSNADGIQGYRLLQRWNSTGSAYFQGLVAHVAIWHAEVKANEVLRLYQGASPLAIHPGRLISYWPLDGDAGGIERDVASFKHLTVTGAVNVEHTPTVLYVPDDIYYKLSLAAAGQYTDAETITVDIQASGSELLEATDSATILVDIQPSGVETQSAGYEDAATVLVDIQVTSTESREVSDSATVLVNIQASGTEFVSNAPVNDDFANVIALSTTLPGTLTGLTTFDATEEAGEVDLWGGVGTHEQSIWFSFTPTVSGWYLFKVPLDSISYHGTHGSSSGELNMALFNATADTLAEFTHPNKVSDSSMFTDPGWQFPHHGILAGELVNGTTYYLKFASSFGTTLNRSTIDFDLEWDLIPAVANADFANRQTISGSSGSVDVDLGPPSPEVDEPASVYWNRGFMDDVATVWYEWTCPATGWYQFEFEEKMTDVLSSATMAFYTGSALNALTAVVKNNVGSDSDIAVFTGQTKIRFNATNGTVYKIQLGAHGPTVIGFEAEMELRWATASAPTGDTGATALDGGFNTARIDNLGNTDNDNPSDGITRLSAHEEWWYTDGAIGRSKWFKQTITETGELRIEAENFAYISDDHVTFMEYGLLVYKGATFGTITAATAQDAQDAILLGFEGGGPFSSFSGPAEALNDDQFLDVPVTNGEIVWLCLVTLYDEDINNEATQTAFPADAPQGELDLKFGTDGTPEVAADNDDIIGLGFGYDFFLGRSEFGGYDAQSEATQREGHTFHATSEVGEAAHAGFGPTRSVWYGLDLGKSGTWKIWVESDVDCVMSLYSWPFFGTLGASLGEDDDSGEGDNPELTLLLSAGAYAVAVDSKTEGFFTLKMQREGGASPPFNDTFADAEEITSLPFVSEGTTVDANAEPFEREAQELGTGPKDTVWYKYVADHDGILSVKATVPSNVHNDAYVYIDTWKGDDAESLVRWPEPPPQGPGGGLWKGFFSFFDTPLEIDLQAVTLDVVNGETYWFRVQSESGGSEEFTIYVDEHNIYIDIQPGGADAGPTDDGATVYINIAALGTEIHHQADAQDSAEIFINIQASGTELQADEYVDSATFYIDIQFMGGECYSTFSALMMDSEADLRWIASATTRWTSVAELRWEIGDIQVEGINC